VDGREPDPTAKRLQAVAANAAIVTWLSSQQLDAHSDLVDELNRAAHGLTDVQI
jgi:hypothetical protein